LWAGPELQGPRMRVRGSIEDGEHGM
jgi:hypothetical protein